MDEQFKTLRGSMEQKELKQFVLGWCDNQLFSSEHIAQRLGNGYDDQRWAHDVGMVFLPVSMGCLACPVEPPQEPEGPPQELLDAIEWGEDGEDSLESYKEAQEEYERQIGAFKKVDEAYGKYLAKNLGIVWEWYDKSLPRGINGMPMFMSCRLMNKEDWERVKTAIDKELSRRGELEV